MPKPLKCLRWLIPTETGYRNLGVACSENKLSSQQQHPTDPLLNDRCMLHCMKDIQGYHLSNSIRLIPCWTIDACCTAGHSWLKIRYLLRDVSIFSTILATAYDKIISNYIILHWYLFYNNLGSIYSFYDSLHVNTHSNMTYWTCQYLSNTHSVRKHS